MDDGVELFGEVGFEVVGGAFCVGAVDDADGAFEEGFIERAREFGVGADVQEKIVQAGLVEEIFEAVRQAWANAFDFGGSIPIVGGHDGASVGGEAEVPAVAVVTFADQLAEVEFTAFGHLGGARVAEMGVVSPDDGFWFFAVFFQVGEKVVEGVGHVGVAKVPGVRAAAIHGAVIMFGVGGDAGVLFGIEEFVGGGAVGGRE